MGRLDPEHIDQRHDIVLGLNRCSGHAAHRHTRVRHPSGWSASRRTRTPSRISGSCHKPIRLWHAPRADGPADIDDVSVADGMVRLVKRVVTRAAHEIRDRPPLQLSVGEEVRLGDYDATWPKFVFVTAEHGSGWVPARHLSESSGTAVVETAYDTTELPTLVGDVLEVLAEDEISGWLWCRSIGGRQGWVPLATVEDDA